MSVIATALKHLMAAGVTGDALVAAVAEIEASMPSHADEAAERRRQKDRERKRLVRGNPQTSAESAESADTVPHAHVVITTSSSLRSEEAYPPPTPKGVVAPPTKSKAPTSPRSRRVPAGWTPSEAALAVAEADGFSPGEIERELAKFRDHEFSRGITDWDAACRNWFRSPFRRPSAQNGQRPDPKLAARQANIARAWAGSEVALGDGRRALGDP